MVCMMAEYSGAFENGLVSCGVIVADILLVSTIQRKGSCPTTFCDVDRDVPCVKDASRASQSRKHGLPRLNGLGQLACAKNKCRAYSKTSSTISGVYPSL